MHGFVVRRLEAQDFASFLSHVNEDGEFVAELKAEIAALSGRGGKRPALQCFLARHDWPLGNVPSEAIKDNLLRSEDMVPIVTPQFLEGNRGRVWYELAYSELIELWISRDHQAIRFPYIAPIFRGVQGDQVHRTPLITYWQRNLLDPMKIHSAGEVAGKLVEFYDQESRKRGDLA